MKYTTRKLLLIFIGVLLCENNEILNTDFVKRGAYYTGNIRKCIILGRSLVDSIVNAVPNNSAKIQIKRWKKYMSIICYKIK